MAEAVRHNQKSIVRGIRMSSAIPLDLDDDHATLEAALALIDEWDLELGALSSSPASAISAGTDSDDQSTQSSSSSAASSPPPAPIPQPTKRRKERSDDEHRSIRGASPPAHMQKREELIYLRRKVRELKSQLATMQDESTDKNTDTAHPQSARELSSTWVWQQIAARQLKQRQKAEHENLRLRVMVEEQLKIAKDLTRVLMRAYQRSQEQQHQGVQGNGFKRVKMPKDGLGQVSAELQLARIDELRVESEAIFHTPPYTGSQPVFRKIDLFEHANGETTINVDCSWVLPFPVEMVAHSFWRYLVKKTSCPRQDCARDGWGPYINDNHDTISAPYEANALAKQLVGTFIGQYTARRFRMDGDGKNEQLIITDMRAEPTAFKPISMDGVRMNSEIIVRVVWADDGLDIVKADTGGRMTKFQVSHRVHIKFAAGETPTRRRRVDALTNYMFYSLEGELHWKQEMLENLLLQAASMSVPALSGITELRDHS